MGWKDILKVLPPDDWLPYSYPEKDPISGDYRAKFKDIGTIRYIVRPHYLDRLYDTTKDGHGHFKGTKNTDDMEKWVQCAKGLGVGRYWMYANDNEKDLDVIIFDVIREGQEFPGHANNKKLDRSIRNVKTGEQIRKVVFFFNYFGVRFKGTQKAASEFDATQINCFYTGLKPNHKERTVADAKTKKKRKIITVDPSATLEESTETTTEPEKPKKEHGKLVSEYLKDVKGFNIDLPINIIKDMITKKGKSTWPMLGRKQRRELIQDAERYKGLR
tara:strand:+ start:2568 stop:3389 length:822 start_codon:yes stop_codon:yes gene_type:complete